MADIWIQIDGNNNVIGRFSRPQPSLQNVYKVDSSIFDGKPIPHRYNPQTQLASTDVVALQSIKKAEVDSIYYARIAEPYVFNGKEYQADEQGIKNLQAGLLAVLAGKASIDWTAKDNTRSTFTAASFKELCTGIFDRGQALFVAKMAKKAEITAINTEAALTAYDTSAGWP